MFKIRENNFFFFLLLFYKYELQIKNTALLQYVVSIKMKTHSHDENVFIFIRLLYLAERAQQQKKHNYSK